MSNTFRVQRLDGSTESLSAPRVRVHEERVLDLSTTFSREPTTCGELLGAVLGFLRDAREYLHSRDRARHATFVRELMDHRLEWEPLARSRRSNAVVGLSSHDLERALVDWIESYFRRDDQPFHLSFALDTAAFLERIVYGAHVHGRNNERLHVKGLLESDRDYKKVRFLNESQFRKRVTQDSVRRIKVLARVPPRGRVVHSEDGREILAAGAEFGLQLVRCHLSQPPPIEAEELRAIVGVDGEPLEFDLASGFEFRGELLLVGSEDGQRTPWSPGMRYEEWERTSDSPIGVRKIPRPALTVPAHWFTDVIAFSHSNDRHAFRRTPLPSWAGAHPQASTPHGLAAFERQSPVIGREKPVIDPVDPVFKREPPVEEPDRP